MAESPREYPEPAAMTDAETTLWLGKLPALLDGLDKTTLPLEGMMDSAYKLFTSFKLDAEILEKTGCPVATLGEQLEGVFGFRARSSGTGIIQFTECGPSLNALAPLLEQFFKEHPSNAVMKKWIIDVVKAAEAQYLADEIPEIPAPAATKIILKFPAGKVPNGTKAADKKRKSEALAEHVQPPAAKKKPGAKQNSLMNKLAVSGQDETKTKNQHFWRCIASKCSYQRQGRRYFPEVLAHAQNCKPLEAQYPAAVREVSEYLAGQALSTIVKDAESGDVATDVIDVDTDVDLGGEASTTKRGPGRPKNLSKLEPGQSVLDLGPFWTAGRKQTEKERNIWQAKADHLLMLLICQCGLVPDLINSDTWKAFVRHLNPVFETHSSFYFTNRVIPAEVAKIKILTTSALQKAGPSTLTLDGTQTRQESFYTLHGTTPKDKVYFLGGHFGSKESHTAQCITEGAVKVMEDVGVEKWAAVVSDSTNVTLAARRGITEKVPTALDLCDVVHFLQHVIGDITTLPEFNTMLTNMKPLIRYFSKSGKSKANLKDAGVGMLAKIGKTRFATHYMAAISIERALESIRDLAIKEIISFKSKRLMEMFTNKYSFTYTEFARDLLQYQLIIDPLARSLWSLEATTANPSDALVFWVAAAHALESILTPSQGKSTVPSKLAGRIRAVFNARYHQFFSHNDVYFVGFCLDPRYPNAEYLRERETRAKDVADRIKFSHAFSRVKTFIKDLLKSLMQEHARHAAVPVNDCKCHPILKTKKPSDIVRECLTQLEAFWQGEAPFHTPVLNDDTMEWWENLAIGGSPRSGVLAMLAVRIFGILVNSMPDERTNSKITWLNSPLRGSQKAENLLNMVMVGQWYTYHAEGAKGPARPPRRPTVAFRRLDPALVEMTKLKGTENSDLDGDSDSDLDSDQSDQECSQREDTLRPVAEQVPAGDTAAADDSGAAAESDYDDEKVKELRRRLTRAKRAVRKKGKKSTVTVETHTKFVVDEDIDMRAPGLKALLTDATPDSVARTEGDIIDVDGHMDVDWNDEALWNDW